ncbi:hypothetical protein NL108_015986 [Boleophthalmus pectinirostris]|nr:hypothetical protein NL108_015986 [Boleophthalmus pectinirostris]
MFFEVSADLKVVFGKETENQEKKDEEEEKNWDQEEGGDEERGDEERGERETRSEETRREERRQRRRRAEDSNSHFLEMNLNQNHNRLSIKCRVFWPPSCHGNRTPD